MHFVRRRHLAPLTMYLILVCVCTATPLAMHHITKHNLSPMCLLTPSRVTLLVNKARPLPCYCS
jgi:hypothetical protein